MADVDGCVQRALTEPLGLSWRMAGEAPDVRSLTAICLAVRLDDAVIVSVSSARGSPNPSTAWHDIRAWNVVNESANVKVVRAWARRVDDGRVSLPIRREVSGTSEEALRAQILEKPEDDAPRDVLADLLTERGDPRGEFIAIQTAHARRPDAALAARADALIREHGRRWARIHHDEATVTFRRGFVESVRVFTPTITPELSALCEREPVRELRFVGSRRFDVHTLSVAPWLSRLRSLEFAPTSHHGASAITKSELEVLCESTSLRELEQLTLRGQNIGDEGSRTLVELGARAMPKLTAIALEEVGFATKACRHLGASRWVARLNHLALSDNALQVQGVEALLSGSFSLKWRALRLAGAGLGNSGAMVLARASRLNAVEALWLARNRIGPTGLAAILDAPQFKKLREVEFTGNPIGASGRTKLAARFGPAPHDVE